MKYVTIEKAAESIGITKWTLIGWIRNGYVRTVKVGNRRLVDMTSIGEGSR